MVRTAVSNVLAYWCLNATEWQGISIDLRDRCGLGCRREWCAGIMAVLARTA